MVAHGSVGHDHTSLKTNTRSNLRIGTNNDIGADDGCGVDFRRLSNSIRVSCHRILYRVTHRVNHHVTTIHPLVLGGVSEQRRMLGSEVGKVEAGTCQEVFWLTDIHPEPLEVERMQLLIGSDCGENFFFDRSGAELQNA